MKSTTKFRPQNDFNYKSKSIVKLDEKKLEGFKILQSNGQPKIAKIIKIIIIILFVTSCSKDSINNSSHEGTYTGTIVQNGPTGITNYTITSISFRVFENNKIQSGLDNRVVKFNLTGSNFKIIPDTSIIGVNMINIVTGNGKFNKDELTLEWNEKTIYYGTHIENINLKGTLKK
jgi:hypothetical protein